MSKPEAFYRVTRGFLSVVADCHKSAAILDQMVRWQKWVDRQKDRDGWFYKSGEQLADDLMGLCSGRYCRMKLRELEEAGLLESLAPKDSSQATMWRVNIRALQRALFKNGYTLEGYTIDPLELTSDDTEAPQAPELSSDPPDLNSEGMELRSDPPGSQFQQQRVLYRETSKETSKETADARSDTKPDEVPPVTTVVSASTKKVHSPFKRYQEILDRPEPDNFLQGLFEYHFDELIKTNQWDSLPSPASIGAIWVRVLGDLGGNQVLARDFLSEKLAEFDGATYPRRVIVKALQTDARKWLIDQRPEHIQTLQAGRNDYEPTSEDADPLPSEELPSVDQLAEDFAAKALPEPWQSTLDIVERWISSRNFKSWFVELLWHGQIDDTAFVIARDEFSEQWVKENYTDMLTDALQEATNKKVTQVEIHTRNTAPDLLDLTKDAI